MKTTKRALLTSVMALILCFSMLVGTTFAWFTDEVKSGINTIVAGNLDVEMLHTNSIDTDEQIKSDTVLFDDVKLWEPGALTYEILTVQNVGTLGLKYQLNINFENATVVDGHTLAEALKVAVVEADKLTDREAAIAAGTEAGWKELESFMLAGELAGVQNGVIDNDVYGIVIYWEPTDAETDNLFNMNNDNQGKKLTIDLGVHLYATQLQAEEDSFGKDYDEGAYLPVVYNAEELQSALLNNESVRLGADIDLTQLATPYVPFGDKDAGIYYTGTLDGAGHTVSGLAVNEGDYVALISAAKDATIKNLTVEGTVSGKNASGIVARVEGNSVIENCVSNVTVSGTTKAGGIACNVTGADAKIINCVNNANISGGNSGIGGIVGYVNNDAYLEIINCTNNGDVTSTTNKYAGAAAGYAAGTSKGIVAGFTNTGTITGTVLNDGRYLKNGETVLCGYVGTIGNWILAATPATVQAMVDNAVAGDVITMYAGDYGTIVMKSGVTLVGGEGVVVDCVNLNGASGVTLQSITFDAAGAQRCVDNKAERSYGCIISGTKDASVGSRELVVDGCTFTGTFANGGAAIVLADRGRPTGGSGNVTIKNCTFDTVGAYYDVYGYYTGNPGLTFVIENNKFNSDCLGLPIYLGRLKTSEAIVVQNNHFKNVDDIANAVFIQGDGYTPTLSEAGNTFR